MLDKKSLIINTENMKIEEYYFGYLGLYDVLSLDSKYLVLTHLSKNKIILWDREKKRAEKYFYFKSPYKLEQSDFHAFVSSDKGDNFFMISKVEPFVGFEMYISAGENPPSLYINSIKIINKTELLLFARLRGEIYRFSLDRPEEVSEMIFSNPELNFNRSVVKVKDGETLIYTIDQKNLRVHEFSYK